MFLEVNWSEFGLTGVIVGLIVIPIVSAFLRYTNSARADLKQVNSEFTNYLKDMSGKQTEALVSVGNALQQSMEASRKHEERANRRHAQVMTALGKDSDLD